MKGLRTEAPPAGHTRTSFLVGSKALVPAPPQRPLAQTDLYPLSPPRSLCPVVMETHRGFRVLGPMVCPCLSLPQGSVTRSTWPAAGCQMIINMC